MLEWAEDHSMSGVILQCHIKVCTPQVIRTRKVSSTVRLFLAQHSAPILQCKILAMASCSGRCSKTKKTSRRTCLFLAQHSAPILQCKILAMASCSGRCSKTKKTSRRTCLTRRPYAAEACIADQGEKMVIVKIMVPFWVP